MAIPKPKGLGVGAPPPQEPLAELRPCRKQVMAIAPCISRRARGPPVQAALQGSFGGGWKPSGSGAHPGLCSQGSAWLGGPSLGAWVQVGRTERWEVRGRAAGTGRLGLCCLPPQPSCSSLPKFPPQTLGEWLKSWGLLSTGVWGVHTVPPSLHTDLAAFSLSAGGGGCPPWSCVSGYRDKISDERPGEVPITPIGIRVPTQAGCLADRKDSG